MIVHDVEQGTDAWLLLRLGMPTASSFAKVYSANCKVPKAFDDYCYQLAAEKVTGKRTEIYVNDYMRRGTELEPVAVAAYEFIMEKEMEVIGFVTNDEQTIGCSPDRLGLEIKCPASHNHLRYLAEAKCPSQYYPQVQGCIWLCGTDSWDFMSYHPGLAPFIITVHRDDDYINGLSGSLNALLERVEEIKQTIGEQNV